MTADSEDLDRKQGEGEGNDWLERNQGGCRYNMRRVLYDGILTIKCEKLELVERQAEAIGNTSE